MPPSILLNPAIIRSSVVLPHPDGPRRVKNSPFRTVSERSGITVVSPYFFKPCEISIATLISFLLPDSLKMFLNIFNFMVFNINKNLKSETNGKNPKRSAKKTREAVHNVQFRGYAIIFQKN